MRRASLPCVIGAKEGDATLWLSMGYPSRQNPLEGTGRYHCALPPDWGSRFVGQRKVGTVGG